MLLGAFLVYILQGILYAHYWDKGLSAQICFAKSEIGEGESCELKEIIVNKKLLPVPMLHVKFETDRGLEFQGENNMNVSDRCYKNDIFSLMMYQKVTRTLCFTGKKRGFYQINRLDLVSTDLFMKNSLLNSMENQTQILVYPKAVDMTKLFVPFKNMMGMVLVRQYSYEDPFEFRGIRQYQSYDSMKDVNWKASAKTGELKVNVHDYTARQEVMILLDLKDETQLVQDAIKEESIRLANSLAGLFAVKGIPVGIISNGKDILTKEELCLSAGSGRLHIQTVRECLARLDLKQPVREIMKVWKERAKEKGLKPERILYVIISYSQRMEQYREFCAVGRECKGSVWLLPLFRSMEQKIRSDAELRVIRWEVPD